MDEPREGVEFRYAVDLARILIKHELGRILDLGDPHLLFELLQHALVQPHFGRPFDGKPGNSGMSGRIST